MIARPAPRRAADPLEADPEAPFVNDPRHADPAGLAACLALDAAAPLYPRLGVPPGDGSLALQDLLKAAMDRPDPTPRWSPALWQQVTAQAEAAPDPEAAKAWLAWIENAFTGIHPADVDLSGWLMAIDHYGLPGADWGDAGLTPDQAVAANAFVDAYRTTLDEPAFLTAAQEARAQPLTDWDKRMHGVHDFVYFDDRGGKDPFLELKFVNQGEALRRTLRDHAFPDDFPHAPLQAAAQTLIDRRGAWMPPGRRLRPLREVA